MGKLTVQKSGHAHNHAEKPPVVLDSKSDPNPSKKHGRNNTTIQSKHSSKSHIPDEPEVISEDEEPYKPVKDISFETYTLYKSVMLGDIMVIGDMDFLKHKKVVSDDKHGFEYVSGSALIGAKNVPAKHSVLITLEDNFCWAKVE